MAVFQPGEETAQGAQAMIDDGLSKRFPTPEVVLGQHVMVGPSGSVAGSSGPITSAADSLQIRLFDRGAHGSMPQASIDPIVMAAAVVLRLQTIVSREVAATDAAVVTVGVLQAGTKENIIPDEAIIKLNVRTFDANVRKHVLAAIAKGDCRAARTQGPEKGGPQQGHSGPGLGHAAAPAGVQAPVARRDAVAGSARIHLANLSGLRRGGCGKSQDPGRVRLSALWAHGPCRRERGKEHPRKRIAVNGGARRGSLFRGVSREVGRNQREPANQSG